MDNNRKFVDVVSNGRMNGNTVYVCDFRWDDLSKKPLRKVKPTKVMIMDKGNKVIYYSHSYFAKINKNGTVSSSVIKLFDNTGYRSLSGTPLNIFLSEKECVDFYKKQCKVIKDNFTLYEQTTLNKLETLKKEINEL